MADAEATGRLISLGLRSGIPLQSVIKQLRGVVRSCGWLWTSQDVVGARRCRSRAPRLAPGQAGDSAELIRGTSNGEYPAYQTPTLAETPVVVPVSVQGGMQAAEEEYHADNKSVIGTCPDCGSQLEFAEGCGKCHVCGFSECG
jgi:ribonucleoside-diphosphate reductase alpha chain